MYTNSLQESSMDNLTNSKIVSSRDVVLWRPTQQQQEIITAEIDKIR